MKIKRKEINLKEIKIIVTLTTMILILSCGMVPKKYVLLQPGQPNYVGKALSSKTYLLNIGVIEPILKSENPINGPMNYEFDITNASKSLQNHIMLIFSESMMFNNIVPISNDKLTSTKNIAKNIMNIAEEEDIDILLYSEITIYAGLTMNPKINMTLSCYTNSGEKLFSKSLEEKGNPQKAGFKHIREGFDLTFSEHFDEAAEKISTNIYEIFLSSAQLDKFSKENARTGIEAGIIKKPKKLKEKDATLVFNFDIHGQRNLFGGKYEFFRKLKITIEGKNYQVTKGNNHFVDLEKRYSLSVYSGDNIVRLYIESATKAIRPSWVAIQKQFKFYVKPGQEMNITVKIKKMGIWGELGSKFEIIEE